MVAIPNLETDNCNVDLLEGRHYRRRFYQPYPPTNNIKLKNKKAKKQNKEVVRCLFCDTSSYPDDVEHGGERVDMQSDAKGFFALTSS